MFCVACGSKNPDGALYCQRCGKAVNHAEFPDTRPQNPEAERPALAKRLTDSDSSRLVGVRGWLLLLCWTLCIVGPLYNASILVMSWQEASAYLSSVPGSRDMLLILSIYVVLTTIFGVYAGRCLWNVTPGAVALGKSFFVFKLVAGTLAFAWVLSLETLPNEVRRNVGAEGAKHVISGTVVFLIWFIYLFKSKRVRATYGRSTLRDWQDNTLLTSDVLFGAVACLALMGAIAYSNLPPVATQAPTQATTDWDKGAITPPANPAPTLTQSKGQLDQGKPNFESQGWTQESTGSTIVGPWIKYDPPGTRYWRDYQRIIYRVYPPGIKPNAEKANPLGLDASEDFVQ